MSGFETLAQVYREIAYPKLKNLRITANIVCWYAVVCTGVITVFAGMIISPEDIRNLYADNLLGGLAMQLAGPELLRLVFHIFVVIVGVLILSGAVNTSIIGANGVLNRVAEDGVLLDWFRKPHKRFGTTHRMVNTIALLQLATIIASRGDVYLLGEAYAFGVVWSFFLKSLGVLVLRYQRHDQEYKFPFNIRLGRVEIPIGLGVTTLILGFVAIANLFSKEYATKYGVGFTLVVFVIFTISEHVNARKRALKHLEKKPLEEFNLEHQPQVTSTLHARPGCILVAVRDYHNMEHLRTVLQKTNLRRHDIVVMTVRTISTGAGEYDLSDDQIFSDYERELFSSRCGDCREGGKAGGTAGGSSGESLRRYGAIGREAQGIAIGDRRFGSHDVGGIGASNWPGVGKPAGASPCVFARGDQSGSAVHVCQPGPPSAASVAGGCRSSARAVAADERG